MFDIRGKKGQEESRCQRQQESQYLSLSLKDEFLLMLLCVFLSLAGDALTCIGFSLFACELIDKLFFFSSACIVSCLFFAISHDFPFSLRYICSFFDAH